MEQLMGKVKCGGTCGDKEHFTTQDQIYWSLWTLEILSFPILYSETPHSGIFTQYIAGKVRKVYDSTNQYGSVIGFGDSIYNDHLHVYNV